MQRFRPRLLLAAAALASAAGVAGASEPAPPVATTSASATALRIVIPGTAAAGTAGVSAPPDSVSFGGAFSYGPDGTAVTAASVNVSALTAHGASESATASSDVTGLSLFGGEITASKVSARVSAKAGANTATGGTTGSAVSKLVVLGQPVSATPGAHVPLADWGTLTVLAETAVPGANGGRRTYRATATGLDVTLIAAHGALPAGTRIVVADVAAGARAPARPAPPAPAPRRASPPPPPAAAPPSPPATARPAQAPKAKAKPKAPRKREAKRKAAAAPRAKSQRRRAVRPLRRNKRRRHAGVHVPLKVTPPLGASDYVFPIFGAASFGDTFGAARADVSYHHGDDVFAARGAPVLAVADGTVFSVGFIPIGGNRLWLRDDRGNQFYYAHLVAYSPLAVNGARVHAGDVLGFVGNTGDARGTPFHLHFEIHPRPYLGLGYDGAVDPTSYLDEWRHLEALPAGSAAFPRPVPHVGSGRLPEPGAILLHVADISAADGLDPGSLRTALSAPRAAIAGTPAAGRRGKGAPKPVPLRRG